MDSFQLYRSLSDTIVHRKMTLPQVMTFWRFRIFVALCRAGGPVLVNGEPAWPLDSRWPNPGKPLRASELRDYEIVCRILEDYDLPDCVA